MNARECLYFAYGSNLSSLRLKARLPHVRLVGSAILYGYRLTFDMLSTDGSAKCNIVQGAHEDIVYGAVYALTQSEISRLDAIEGARYARVQLDVAMHSANTAAVYCYVANTFVSNELPFEWYTNHVLVGAQEHGFPEFYIENIRAQKSTKDVDKSKHASELDIYNR
ncbi:gamma-glutamylcyclotransferase family protein [Pseudoalteromonas luteoviolacea]|uniref:Gamma-glutamylcyclotransferase AIG2-like domain-containing protein n=1 Tax=Pseudoalteromonas luteoviolacea S4054 TaxID=1129367 RepID=A0A0F6ADK2_9GAMM|nr:gamma-glutamylcyclotransferase family protein [Pseudoalteromonas luteoviolacea]AOT09617.1 hypothetical protein S4054249_18110 [Pseudoalteromonas luteoviolacea]AOT14529.1 hypothetical protein S40542_18080 [Pseudoalteromonas luteoviolacea]AOT19444.1 hypothetical protein S4054_18085 [Pseudoalteromonas luteoviolacea]KKE83876.1 hypothetical protein N479_10725 [Pseudoalteromonas luteoviolacea S4054]KZN77270.1 hypothetical protein N481_04265 [Pseudoalteromonas luteoviolacea S4047-1]